MHQISVTHLSTPELRQQYEGIEGMPEGSFEHLLGLAADEPQVLETTLHLADGQVEVLVFALPHLDLQLVAKLAQAMPSEYNEASPDLMANYSYLSWRADDAEVRLDFGYCRTFPGGLETRKLLVIFLCNAGAAIAEHTLDEDGITEMLCALQCCGGGAGFNHNPFRLYSEEELESAKDAVGGQQPGLMTAAVLSFGAGRVRKSATPTQF